MAAVTSKQSGNWSDASTWNGSIVPGGGDNITIQNGHTVTLGALLYSGNDTATAAITIAAGGKLQYLPGSGVCTGAVKGDVVVNGVLEVGTRDNPLRPTDTFTMQLNYSATLADGKYGLKVNAGGVCNLFGAPKTPWTLLAADAPVGATSLTLKDAPAGWASNDTVVIAPTGKTYTEVDKKTLSTNPVSGNTLSVTALSYAHAGNLANSPIQAEVINLTRNLQITSYGSYAGYVVVDYTGTFNADNVEFSFLGYNAADKYGVSLKCRSLGSARITNCSVHDGKHSGFYLNDGYPNNWDNIVVDRCVGYNFVAYGGALVSIPNATTGVNWQVTNCVAVYGTTSGAAFIVMDLGGTFSDCRAAGFYATPITLSEACVTRVEVSRLVSHSHNAAAITVNCRNLTLYDTIAARCGSAFGFSCIGSNVMLVNCDVVGGPGYSISGTGHILTGCKCSGEAGNNAIYAVSLGVDAYNVTLENCDFATASGYRLACTSDFTLPTAIGSPVQLVVVGGSLTGAIFSLSSQYGLADDAFIAFHDLGGVPGNHRVLFRGGTARTSTAVFRTSAPAEQLTPNQAALKMRTSYRSVPATAGVPATIKVYIKKDGTYAGANPRLMIKRNFAAGVLSDAQIDTGLGAADANGWQLLTGVTPAPSEDTVFQVYVDCDGTAGNVYVDDWSAA